MPCGGRQNAAPTRVPGPRAGPARTETPVHTSRRGSPNAASRRLHVIGCRGSKGTLGSVLRSAFAIEPSAHRCQDLGHIPHQVVIDLGRIDHHQLTALGANSGFDVLRAEPAESISVFHHDPTYRRVTQQSKELTAVPIARGTDLNNDLVDADLFGRGPRSHPRYSPIQVGLLIC